jgi:hypothetical protein
MKDFGIFAFLVTIVTSLAAAAGAIRLAFMKRTKWQPPEEVVASGTSRLASLLAMVFIALLFVFGARVGLAPLGGITVLLFVIAIVALTTESARTSSIRTTIPPSRARRTESSAAAF